MKCKMKKVKGNEMKNQEDAWRSANDNLLSLKEKKSE